MAITDDLIHGQILGWRDEVGTPAERVERGLQAWRDRFSGEPQVVLYAPAKGTQIRGATDDPKFIERQEHIEFRPYDVVGVNEYHIAVRLSALVQPALPEFNPVVDKVPEVKRRSVKQEAKHQAMIADGTLVNDIVPVITMPPEVVELLPPAPILEIPLPVVILLQENVVEEDDDDLVAAAGFARFARRVRR